MMSELDPAYRDIEVCPCSTPGWKHHTGFHDFVADRVKRATRDVEANLAATKRWAARLASERGDALLRAETAERKVAACEVLADDFKAFISQARANVRGKTPLDKMNGREANVWREAEGRLRAALADPDGGGA